MIRTKKLYFIHTLVHTTCKAHPPSPIPTVPISETPSRNLNSTPQHDPIQQTQPFMKRPLASLSRTTCPPVDPVTHSCTKEKISFDARSNGTWTDNCENRLVIVKGSDDHGGDEDDDEDYYYVIGKRSGWWKRYCSYRYSVVWILLQICWRAMLSLCIALLVFYVVTKPPPPKVSIQMAGIGQFGLGEGVDGSGVTTKFLTCDCSINLIIENKSKLFSLHIHPPAMEMCFGRLPFALSHLMIIQSFQGPKLYAESGSSKFKLYVGTRNKPVYGAERSMDDMLKSGKGLPLVLRVKLNSSFWFVGNVDFVF